MNTRASRVTTLLLQRRRRALKRHLPAAVAGDGEGIHQARVATRRLREAVPVLTAGVKGNRSAKAQRKIRRLTRALGTVRELDVTLRLLGELAQSGDVPRAAVEDVRALVIAERDRRRAAMLRRLAKVNADKLDRRLASVAEALNASTGDGWRDALAARLGNRAKRLERAVEAAGQIYDPVRLHVVRIASKKLRYGLEIVADSRVVAAASHVTTMKRTQEQLGHMHDLQVLQTYVAAVQAKTGASKGLETLARHIEDRCRLLHGRYVASVPQLRELCTLVSTVIVPGLTRGRRRPPLKMTLRRPVSRVALAER